MNEITEADNRAIRRLTERIDDVTEDAAAYGVSKAVIAATLISAATSIMGLSLDDAQEMAALAFAKLEK